MANYVIDKVKTGKLFCLADIFVYSAAALLLAALFLTFVIFPAHAENVGFKVVVEEKTALTYYFSNGDYQIYDFNGSIETESDNSDGLFTFTVFIGGNEDYNVIEVDTENKSVKVVKSNCSIKKDCVFSPPLLDGTGAIFCMPHGLKILPLNENYRGVTTGGL